MSIKAIVFPLIFIPKRLTYHIRRKWFTGHWFYGDCTAAALISTQLKFVLFFILLLYKKGGTQNLPLNEWKWIIDIYNLLIVDFRSQVVLSLDHKQPRPSGNPKLIHFSFGWTSKQQGLSAFQVLYVEIQATLFRALNRSSTSGRPL